MTTVDKPDVHAHRHRRRVRRLPGDRQGAVQRSRRFATRCALSRRQFDQLGAHPRPDRLLFHRRRRARRAGPARLLRRADRQFRRRARRLLRQAHGPADRAADRRHQRERHSRPRAGERRLQAARRQADAIAVDGHSGLLQFRAAAVRGLWPRRGGGARADGRPRRNRANSRSPPAPLAAIRARFRRRSRRRERMRSGNGARLSRERHHPRSAYGGRRPRGAARRWRAIRRRRSSRWRPRIPPNSPTRSRARPACVPRLPPHLARSDDRRERFARAAQRRGRRRAIRSRAARGRRRERATYDLALRACASSPTPTPHLRTAALGVFVGAGSRHERERRAWPLASARTHGFQGHRAGAARARSPRRSRTRAAISTPRPASSRPPISPACCGEDVDLALDVSPTSLTDSRFDADELEREKNVILQEIGAVEDTPDDLVFDLFTAAAWPEQPIGRPILGTRESVGGFDRDAIDAYLRRHYRAGATVVAAGRRRRSR